jgi:ABC-type dipeptide/oligopeptide/nickel transport system permease subunit
MRFLTRTTLIVACLVVLLAVFATTLVLGFQVSPRWLTEVVVIGRVHGTENFVVPPFGPLSTMDLYRNGGTVIGTHFFLLGSDAAGRDMLGLLARGAVPSLLLVACGVVGRLLVGFIAGILMALGSTSIRALSRGMGRWVGGFPYLALAIVLVLALSPRSRFLAFVVALAAVGWRDIAEVTAHQVESVLTQPYALAARALGSEGVTFFRRHVIPNLRPALAVEIPFQASAVLVLLGELGYLNLFLGGVTILTEAGARTPTQVAYRLGTNPELGQLLSDARTYILRDQWLPVLVPAIAIALLALSFELIGLLLQRRDR